MPQPQPRDILARLPDWDAEAGAIEALSGGITNQNFRVTLGGKPCVLRVPGENAACLGIDRRREAACARIAAALGVGPEVVAFLPEEEALVTRFVEGEVMAPVRAREPAVLDRIARALRRYHEGPEFPGRFSAFETVRGYHRLALEKGVSFPPAAARALDRMAPIEAALARGARLAPCHNDLLAANFIDDGERIWILDWEYAAMGDPFFDLGNFAVNQELDDAGCAALLAAYAGEARTSGLARLKLMRLASDLREAFWGFLQSGISTLDFDYAAYGGRHLDRFLESASRPECSFWLKEAGERP
jgi:thiamine kinase-like enzyme